MDCPSSDVQGVHSHGRGMMKSMAIDQAELERLRDDCRRITGRPFVHFLCPITLEDSVGKRGLVDGHILNEAIVGASRATVIQRGDVDSYYGSTREGADP